MAGHSSTGSLRPKSCLQRSLSFFGSMEVIGAAVELGPVRVKRYGTGLEFNTHAWNKEANLLFVESPVGVGFSYTNTSSDLTKLDDGFVAEDACSFLVNWLRNTKPMIFILQERAMQVTLYVPLLAEVIYEHNKDRRAYPSINSKGFIVAGRFVEYEGLTMVTIRGAGAIWCL